MENKDTTLREKLDKALRKEMITIGMDIVDAKTGQMWALDSERLSKIAVSLFLSLLERVKPSGACERSQAIQMASSKWQAVNLEFLDNVCKSVAQAAYKDVIDQLRKLIGGI